MNNKIFKIVLWIAVFQLIGFLIGFSTKGAIATWYVDLEKSDLTPKGYVFSIVWPLLYTGLSYTGYKLHEEVNVFKNWSKVRIFWLGMMLNWAWSPVFFLYQSPLYAACLLCLILILNFILMAKVMRNFPALFCILSIYSAWLIFAFYLNLFILDKNTSFELEYTAWLFKLVG